MGEERESGRELEKAEVNVERMRQEIGSTYLYGSEQRSNGKRIGL